MFAMFVSETHWVIGRKSWI